MNYIDIYYISINILTFIIFRTDKDRAKKNKWRIKESTLFLLGIMGGALGGILGMLIFKHKTKKIAFYVFYITLLIMHIFIFLNIHVLFNIL